MGLFFGARRGASTPPPPFMESAPPSAGSSNGHSPNNSADARSVLLTQDGWLIGELRNPARRTSDGLAASLTMVLMSAEGAREIDRDEVLMVVPPPIDPRPELQIAKRRVPVAIEIGEITVRGQCHLLPGATVWDVWQRSASGFAALTEARIDFPDGTSETAEVVLVSRHAASVGLTSS